MEARDLCRNQNDRRGRLARIQANRPPLVFSPSEWDRVIGYTRDAAEVACKMTERRKEALQKHALSQEMSSTWPNTVVNLRRQRIKMRNERMEKENERRKQVYEEMKALTHAKNEELRKTAKEKLFQNRDEVKHFASAYKFGETLRVRGLQERHNAKLKEEEKMLTDEYEGGILADAQKMREEEVAKKAAKAQEKERLRKEILCSLQKRKEEREREEKMQLEEEQRDLLNMKKEIEAIEAREKKMAEDKRREIRLNIEESKRNDEKKRLQEMEEEKERDEAIRLIAESKKRINRIRKEKEAQIRAEAMEKQEKVKEQVVKAADTSSAKEHEIYLKDKARLEELEDKSREEREEHYNQLRIERIATEREYFRQAQLEKERLEELDKFELLQRYKRDEENKKFNKSLKDKEEEKKKKWVEEIAVQKGKDIQRRADNQENFLDYYRNLDEKYQMNDQEFLVYANNLIEGSQQFKRPTYPMLDNLQNWKKKVSLLKDFENFMTHKELADPPTKPMEELVKEREKSERPPDHCQTELKWDVIKKVSKIVEKANGLLEDKERTAKALQNKDPKVLKMMEEVCTLANGLQDFVKNKAKPK